MTIIRAANYFSSIFFLLFSAAFSLGISNTRQIPLFDRRFKPKGKQKETKKKKQMKKKKKMMMMMKMMKKLRRKRAQLSSCWDPKNRSKKNHATNHCKQNVRIAENLMDDKPNEELDYPPLHSVLFYSLFNFSLCKCMFVLKQHDNTKKPLLSKLHISKVALLLLLLLLRRF
jgi:hypothetical protein